MYFTNFLNFQPRSYEFSKYFVDILNNSSSGSLIQSKNNYISVSAWRVPIGMNI